MMTRSYAFSVLGVGVLATIVSSGCGSNANDKTNGGAGAGEGVGTAAGPTTGPGGDALGNVVDGEYNLGPVEWSGADYNACAPYPSAIELTDGDILAGVSDTLGGDGSYCDACIKITTAKGKTAIARLVTYGGLAARGNLDVSQAAFDALSVGEYPRTMTWQLVSCPGTNPISFQFKVGSNVDWTSLWVRNPRIAVQTLEVKSSRHATFTALQRGPDGPFTDNGGFGDGAFTLRVTGVDGSTFSQDLPGFQSEELVQGTGNL